MKIEFMLREIKNKKNIYDEREFQNEEGYILLKNTYIGDEYTQDFLKKLDINLNVYDFVLKEYYTDVCESFKCKVGKKLYLIKFTINTYNNGQTMISVKIQSEIDEDYDMTLEKLKIEIKDKLLDDWESCIWLVDEQSENLCAKLYPLIFKTENQIRAFVNKVLNQEIGIDWINKHGLERVKKSYMRNSVDFKRRVTEFNDIDDYLMSTTIETLSELIFKTKIYETIIPFKDKDYKMIHSHIQGEKKEALFQKILDMRACKVDVWKDIFSKYIDASIENYLDDFIKNRNHIAHNKLLSKKAYEKIKNNILQMENIFEEAEKEFEKRTPSNESIKLEGEQMEQIAILEQIEEENLKEIEYERIYNDTGIEVMTSNKILQLMNDKIKDVFNDIRDSEYFGYSVTIDTLNSISDDSMPQKLFTVSCKVKDEFSFDVYASIEITTEKGGNSNLELWIEQEENKKRLEKIIQFHNGDFEALENESYYLPVSESYFDDDALNEFTINLQDFISNDMNPKKKELENQDYVNAKENGIPAIAKFPCQNCGEEFISLDEKIYPYGKCANCGEENEIFTCTNCGETFDFDNMECEGGICINCFNRIQSD